MKIEQFATVIAVILVVAVGVCLWEKLRRSWDRWVDEERRDREATH